MPFIILLAWPFLAAVIPASWLPTQTSKSRLSSNQSDTIVTNTVLYLFVHRAIPLRWICVYTDADSNVMHASWKDM